jgi:hypothetical protein
MSNQSVQANRGLGLIGSCYSAARSKNIGVIYPTVSFEATPSNTFQ